eukprot:TRINITY_DN8206_c0_g1_i1.p1 TRINITY_DN8206_c0_g1~~TRINITY_DN8206_c0_g1_i1.p1  ORF type:complete len:124 (-),score=14.26 TRINITY_DN8206_c0_g1_i1:494-865(-)
MLPNGNPRYRNALHCLTKTVRKEGFRGLYKGLSSPLMGDSLTNSVIFGVYGILRTLQLGEGQTDEDMQSLSLLQISLAGAGVGLAAGTILTPVELIKARLQIQTDSHSPTAYKGPIDCLKKKQ